MTPTFEMLEAFWSKVEVQRTGAIHGLEDGLAAVIALLPGEPVAYRYQLNGHDGAWSYVEAPWPEAWGRGTFSQEPLYTSPAPLPVAVKAKWIGDKRLIEGSEVEILATDPQDPNVPGRRACWVRHWPSERDFPVYRSCDLSDLEFMDDAFDVLAAAPAAPTPASDISALREEIRRLRNKVPTRALTDSQLDDEAAAIDEVMTGGFGEGGGSPGEWWYERADEIAHERKRRQLENELADHNRSSLSQQEESRG